MRVTMRTLAAGPDGTMHPDKTYDLPPKQAQELIKAGAAVAAEPKAPAVPVQRPVEPATKPGGNSSRKNGEQESEAPSDPAPEDPKKDEDKKGGGKDKPGK